MAERRAIQFDLVWTGDYTGVVSAEITDRVIAAVKAFQRKNRTKETGVLNPQERAALAAAAKVQQEQVGWRIIDDPVTGARLGIPTKQVPQSGAGKTGTRWSSAQGQVQVETFRIAGSGTTLPAIFEQQKKDPPQRRVETSVLRPEFFVLTGSAGAEEVSRARPHPGQGGARNDHPLRPVQRRHHGSRGGRHVERIRAFSAGTVAVAPAARRQVEYGTGIVVSSAGHVVTDRQVIEGCQCHHGGGARQRRWAGGGRAADLALIASMACSISRRSRSQASRRKATT